MATKSTKKKESDAEQAVTLDLGELPDVNIPDSKSAKFISDDNVEKQLVVDLSKNFFELCNCIRSLDDNKLSVLKGWDIAVAYDIFLREILYNDNYNAITAPTAIGAIIGIKTKINPLSYDDESGNFCAFYSYIVDIIDRIFRRETEQEELFNKDANGVIRAYSYQICREFTTFTNELLDEFRSFSAKLPGVNINLIIDPLKFVYADTVSPDSYFKHINHLNHNIWFSSNGAAINKVDALINGEDAENFDCIGVQSFLIYGNRPSFPIMRVETFSGDKAKGNQIFSTDEG